MSEPDFDDDTNPLSPSRISPESVLTTVSTVVSVFVVVIVVIPPFSE